MLLIGGFQAQGSRKEQQDSFGILEKKDKDFTDHAGFLAVVADGMGGLSKGSEASQLAVASFIESYQKKDASEPIENALLRCMYECNERVFEFSEKEGLEGKTGTTLVATVVQGNNLYWISVGDSRIYLIQKDQVTCLTSDHNYDYKLQELVSKGEMTQEEAQSNPQKSALTSFIGSESIQIIGRNTHPIKCFNSDQILLCSDGLYSRMSDEEITKSLGRSPKESSKRLVENKLNKKVKNQDNLTAVIIKMGGQNQETSLVDTPKKFAVISLLGIVFLVALLFYANTTGFSWTDRLGSEDKQIDKENETFVVDQARTEQVLLDNPESTPITEGKIAPDEKVAINKTNIAEEELEISEEPKEQAIKVTKEEIETQTQQKVITKLPTNTSVNQPKKEKPKEQLAISEESQDPEDDPCVKSGMFTTSSCKKTETLIPKPEEVKKGCLPKELLNNPPPGMEGLSACD